MPNKKISQLDQITSITGTEQVPIVQNGLVKRTTTGAFTGRLKELARASNSVTIQDAKEIARATLLDGLSAGSITQQDLSGIAAGLHRSPSAVTAMFVYDTSKDSDGGAWTKQCQNTSWYNEPLSGRWLGAVTGTTLALCETNARLLSNNANDYFQASFDGKFYKLNKNLLTGTAVLATQTQLLTAGTYTISSTTASTGSVAISGAATATHTPGTPTTFTVATSGNVTFTVTGSVLTAQVETGSIAYEYRANTTTRVTEVFRGNKAEFPTLSAIVAEAASVTIYDLTESGNPMWRRFTVGATSQLYSNQATSLAAVNGQICVGGSSLSRIMLVRDIITNQYSSLIGTFTCLKPISVSNSTPTIVPDASLGLLVGNPINTVAMTVLPDALVDPVSGLKIPTIVVATQGGISLIKNGSTVYNTTQTISFDNVKFTNQGLIASRTADSTFYYYPKPSNISANFTLLTESSGIDFNQGTTTTIIAKNKSEIARLATNKIQLLKHNETTVGKGLTATITPTYNTGYMTGDIRRCYLSDIDAGIIDNPSTITDRSYKATTVTVIGTLAKTAVAVNSQLVAYSGFSSFNYIREAYSSDLDFGTGEWSISSWINIPVSNATAGDIVSRSYSAGSYITLGIDSTNKITLSAYDGTNTRTIVTDIAYNTGSWLSVETNYTPTDTALTIRINGQTVKSVTGTALLSLNNSNAQLTIGNNFNLDGPFLGSVNLLKLSATVPTTEQSQWMYEQEKQLFSTGVNCTLPDTNSLVDLSYDDETNRLISISSSNESYWSGLVRVDSQHVTTNGSFTKVSANSGIRLISRSTTDAGVDVKIPAYNIKTRLEQDRSDSIKQTVVFDYDPIDNSQVAFVLPIGFTAIAVYKAGIELRETISTTKDWSRSFDGFKETITLTTAPGTTNWIQIHATKE